MFVVTHTIWQILELRPTFSRDFLNPAFRGREFCYNPEVRSPNLATSLLRPFKVRLPNINFLTCKIRVKDKTRGPVGNDP